MNDRTQQKRHLGYVLVAITMSDELFYVGRNKTMTKGVPPTDKLFECLEDAQAHERDLRRRWAQPSFCGVSQFCSIHEVVEIRNKRKVIQTES